MKISFILPFFLTVFSIGYSHEPNDSSIFKGDSEISSICSFLTQEERTPEILALFQDLFHNGYVERAGSDQHLRPVFVQAQITFERAIVHYLSSGELTKALCLIHTPAPATPICMEEEITDQLLSPIIQNDPIRRLTVQKRPNILREYLKNGGELFSIFPEKGRSLRSMEQLAIFDHIIQTNPNAHAISLNCETMPEKFSGATYLLYFGNIVYVLSLQSYQAHSETNGSWAIWFGKMDNPLITDRLNIVLSFLKAQGFSLENPL